MKQHLDISHEGNLTETAHRMSFDENSIAHLMGVLTDLYGDKAMAVIREYSTNARDSHVAAGNPDPIEVELPTGLNPTLTIRDRGLGMSRADLLDVFSKYGASTKRDSDTQVGMLGLGCKSGLSYTDQFTLVATQDGQQIVVLVTRDEDGCGVLQLIDEAETTDPNGVEVQLPVSDVREVVKKVQTFFWFWDSGTVLIDGQKPESVWDTGARLDPDVVITECPSFMWNLQDTLVMGGVPYPIEGHILQSERARVIARVPVGAVNFAPSREALQMTRRTTEVVADLKEFARGGVRHAAQLEVNAAATPAEAFTVAQGWRKRYLWLSLNHHGEALPVSFRGPFYDYKMGYRSQTRRDLEDAAVPEVMLVTDYPQMGVRDSTKAAVKRYLETLDNPPARIIFAHDNLGRDVRWFTHVMAWEDLKVATTAPKAPREKHLPMWRVVNPRGFEEEVADLPTGQPICYVEAARRLNAKPDRPLAILRDVVPSTYTLLVVGTGALRNLLKEDPTAVHVGMVLEEVNQTLRTKQSDLSVSMSFNSYVWSHSALSLVRPDELLDLQLAASVRELIAAAKEAKTKNVQVVQQARNRLRAICHQLDVVITHQAQQTDAVREVVSRWEDTYPLLAVVDAYSEHRVALTEYLNDTYLSRRYFSAAAVA